MCTYYYDFEYWCAEFIRYTLRLIENMTKELSPELIKYIENETKDMHFQADVPVFLSSTKEDLIEERLAIIYLLEKIGLSAYVMENFGAHPESPLETCLSELEKSRIYIGIIGMRYGSLYTSTDGKKKITKSYTEMEYEKACENGLCILIYCINEHEGLVHPSNIDFVNYSKLKAFKSNLKEKHTVYPYSDTRDLIKRVLHDVVTQVDKMLESSKSQKTESLVSLSLTKSKNAYITLSLDGTGAYYLTASERISGISTFNSEYVYLHLLKETAPISSYPNIPESDFCQIDTDGGKYIKIPVLNDSSWSTRFDFSKLIGVVDAGTYLLLAAPYPYTQKSSEMGDNDYVVNRIILKTGFLTATTYSSIIIPGVPVYLSGIAETRAPNLILWLCSKHRLVSQLLIPVAQDHSYNYELPYQTIQQLIPGEQYFVVIQMPMITYDGEIKLFQTTPPVITRPTSSGEPDMDIALILDDNDSDIFLPEKLGNLLDRKDINDIYVKLSFSCQKAFISDANITKNNGISRIICKTNLPPGTPVSFKFKQSQIILSKLNVKKSHLFPLFQTISYVSPGSNGNNSVLVDLDEAQYPMVKGASIEFSLHLTGDVLRTYVVK